MRGSSICVECGTILQEQLSFECTNGLFEAFISCRARVCNASCNCSVSCSRRSTCKGPRLRETVLYCSSWRNEEGTRAYPWHGSYSFACWHIPTYENGLHRTLFTRRRCFDLLHTSKIHLRNSQHGYLYHCSVILEPHRFYRGWNFWWWSLLLPFLVTRSNTAWSKTGRSWLGRSAMVNCFLAVTGHQRTT